MEEKIVEILGALQTSVTTLAPEAWAALVIAARIDSILSVAYSMAVLIAVVVWLKTVRRVLAWIKAQADDEPAFAIYGVGTVLLVILAVIAVIVLFSTSTWLGLFYPEAQVVRDLLSAAAGE